MTIAQFLDQHFLGLCVLAVLLAMMAHDTLVTLFTLPGSDDDEEEE